MRELLAGLLSLTACGRLGFDHAGGGSGPEVDAAEDSPDGAGDSYRATPIRFETAGGDYMSSGNLANTTSSDAGTYSAWIRLNGPDGATQLFSGAMILGIGGVYRNANNRIELLMQNCVGAPMLDVSSQSAITAARGWFHLLASWDLGQNRVHIYIDDVPDMGNPFLITGPICYAAVRWGVGGLGPAQLDADVADLYASLGTYIDITVEANRRKFSDASGKAVALGENCSRPTGAVPTACFVGAAPTWHMNKGIGAGMTLSGDGLVTAPDSPSD
jgi:Concanavalin A-like lectin/glucanases superfamily